MDPVEEEEVKQESIKKKEPGTEKVHEFDEFDEPDE